MQRQGIYLYHVSLGQVRNPRGFWSQPQDIQLQVLPDHFCVVQPVELHVLDGVIVHMGVKYILSLHVDPTPLVDPRHPDVQIVHVLGILLAHGAGGS